MMPRFRAWDNKRKLMIDDVVVIDLYHEYISYLYPSEIVQGEIVSRLPINDVIIMQSTGLEDKNGVEIYEGDILYYEPYKTHSNDRVVEHIDGAYYGRLIRSGYLKLLAECVYKTKVIGNIYENKEVLEVAE